MIDAICSLCGFKGRVPDSFLGRQVKCRECCNMFTVGETPDRSSPRTGLPVKRSTSAPVHRDPTLQPLASPETPPLENLPSGLQTPMPGTVPAPRPSLNGLASRKVPPSRDSRSRGIDSRKARLVVGGVILVAAFGLVFGVGLTMLLKPAPVPEVEAARLGETRPEPAQTQPEPAGTGAAPDRPQPPPRPEPTITVSDQWVDAELNQVRVGDVLVSIEEVEADQVEVAGEASRKFLIRLVIVNRGNPVEYQGWGSAAEINRREPARLTTPDGETVARVAAEEPIEGQVASMQLATGGSTKDLVIFELPPANVQFVRLELPVKNLYAGKEGMIKFHIPRIMFEKSLEGKP